MNRLHLQYRLQYGQGSIIDFDGDGTICDDEINAVVNIIMTP